jgi:ribosomal-protein-alanine N-acetyltransferase
MSKLKAVITPMTLDDIDAVIELEVVSFPTPWPASLYRREITRNPYSRYLVLRPAQKDASLPAILGYGGYWLLDDEAHITTIATHPQWRGHHLGEWLLLTLLYHAKQDGATSSTLEVRPSNTAARSLYSKLGYRQIGRRRNYYSDTREDALLLELAGLDDPQVWRPLQERLDALNALFSGPD